MADKHSDILQDVVDRSVAACLVQMSAQKLTSQELGVSITDMRDPLALNWAGHRQDELIYPASVIKLFYAMAAYHWLEQGRIQKTPEFDRAMHDMIVDSSNDATGYIVDILSGTTSGPELPDLEMAEWSRKRNAVNEFFRQLGYDKINVNQKTWNDGPFGREKVSVGKARENRNMLTTRSTARLVADIILRKATPPQYCDELLGYMLRDRALHLEELDDHGNGFIGPALPADARYWAKAGWTSETRHDAAYMNLVDASGTANICLVIFTVNHANDATIIPFLASQIITRMKGVKHA